MHIATTRRPAHRAAGLATTSGLVCALVLGLTGCTQTIAGTPGPAPTVSDGGDFPSSGSGSDSPSASDTPTDSSTASDVPTDSGTPTDEPSTPPAEDGSVQGLCNDMSDSISGPDIGVDGYRALVGLDILGWGLASDPTTDPFETVDAATTTTCPDVRTAVLAKTQTPDLKTLGS